VSADHEYVIVDEIPDCDLNPTHGKAYADACTKQGPWAYVCKACFDAHCYGLGLGRGQVLRLRIVEPE
jgi:hypothetical protein